MCNTQLGYQGYNILHLFPGFVSNYAPLACLGIWSDYSDT